MQISVTFLFLRIDLNTLVNILIKIAFAIRKFKVHDDDRVCKVFLQGKAYYFDFQKIKGIIKSSVQTHSEFFARRNIAIYICQRWCQMFVYLSK